MTKISESGLIGRDGKLRLPMDRLNAEFAKHPGKRVVVRFEIEERGSSALQQAYYYNYVIPCVVEALREQGTRKSEDATDRWLISQYPGGFRYDGSEQHVARQLTTTQMADFLEWLKQYAAENLDVYVEDPRSL